MKDKYLTRVRAHWQAKNKACEMVQDYAQTKHRTLLTGDQLEAFAADMQAKVDEANKLHTRCKDLKFEFFNSPYSEDYFMCATDAFGMELEKVEHDLLPECPLTDMEKAEITREMLREEPTETIGMVAILKLGEFAVKTNAEEIKLDTVATVNNQRYLLKLVSSFEEVSG